jgi:RimJ/RimL family protein N-acetyltransferase
MKQHPTLHTKRLVLRPFVLADAKDVQRLAGEKAIADTTANIPHPYLDGMAEQWIATHQECFEAGELVNLAIVLQEPDILVGAISLMDLSARHERGELGYWIGQPYWNQGYCTEAAQAVLAYGFSVLGLNRIHARFFKRNPASGRVMEKVGMVQEGYLRAHDKKWEQFEDIVLYGILKFEWHNRTEPMDALDSYRRDRL